MKALHCALLLIIPASLLPLSIVLGHARGPFYLAENSDPEYNYLLNSLSVLTGNVPRHTDHPGTTLQEIGALVEFVEWLPGSFMGDSVGLQKAVLSRPETYLSGMNFALVLLVAGSVFWAGLALFRATGSIIPALVVQGSVFLFYDLLYALARVSPEPLLIATGFALIAVLTPRLLMKRDGGGLAGGAIFGFGLVTKITFAPWVLVLALFHGRSQKVRFAVATLVSAVLLLLPILSRLPVVTSWMISLAIHAGHYGGGPVGVPSPAQWGARARDLFRFQPFIFIWLIYYAAVLAAITLQDRTDPILQATRNVLMIGSGIVAIQLVMTLKHYATHYMVPGLVAFALVNGFIALALSASSLPVKQRAVLGLVGIGVFIGSLVDTKGIILYRIGEGRANQAQAAQLARKVSELGDCVTIGYYRSSLPSFALNFGSEYSGGVHGSVLEEIYGDQITYNRFGGGFWSYDIKPRLSTVEQMLGQGRCVLMQGSAEPGGPPNLPASMSAAPVATIRNEALYRLSLAPGLK